MRYLSKWKFSTVNTNTLLFVQNFHLNSSLFIEIIVCKHSFVAIRDIIRNSILVFVANKSILFEIFMQMIIFEIANHVFDSFIKESFKERMEDLSTILVLFCFLNGTKIYQGFFISVCPYVINQPAYRGVLDLGQRSVLCSIKVFAKEYIYFVNE